MSAIESTDEALVGLGAVLIRIRDVIEKHTPARCSKYIIDHSGNTPSHLINDTFSLEFQSANTGAYRDETAIRARHAVTVTVLRKLRPADQFADQLAGVAREEQIMRALGDHAATAEVRVGYEGADRTLSPTREYLISQVKFNVEHDWWSQS